MTASPFHPGGDAPQNALTEDDRSGRAHVAEVPAFDLRQGHPTEKALRLAIDFADFRSAVTSGAYELRLRDQPPGLRDPAEIASRDGTQLGGLRFREAAVLCEIAGGLLPTERQADLILHRREIDPGERPRAFWTSSYFDQFAYDRLYHDRSGHWRADGRSKESPYYTVVVWEGGRVRRFPGEPRQDRHNNIALEALIVVSKP